MIIFLFLQNWRSTLIPAIAIPVSLIGTFIFIVVEDVTRRIQEKGESPIQAVIASMNELRSAVTFLR